MITREKCLELASAAGFDTTPQDNVTVEGYICTEEIESLVRASVALGMEMAAKESASAEPVAIVGLEHQTWTGYNGQWTPPGEPRKTAMLLKDVPLGERLYLHAPAAVQEGWQLVPKEPTEEMLSKAAKVDLGADTDERGICCNLYLAMLAAAPKPPVQEDAKDAARIRVPTTAILDRREIIDGLEAQIAAMKEAKE